MLGFQREYRFNMRRGAAVMKVIAALLMVLTGGVLVFPVHVEFHHLLGAVLIYLAGAVAWSAR